MRYFVLLIAIALFTSCGLSPQEQLIADHVQQFQGSKLDLKFKPLKTEFVKSETAKDSIDIILLSQKVESVEKFDEAVTFYRQSVYELDSIIEQKDSLYKLAKLANDYDMASIYLDSKSTFGNLKANLLDKGKFIDKVEKQLKPYIENESAIIAKHYKCTYKIFNPLLQTEQEITKTFVFNADETVILNSY